LNAYVPSGAYRSADCDKVENWFIVQTCAPRTAIANGQSWNGQERFVLDHARVNQIKKG
jgi:hypothetical protein